MVVDEKAKILLVDDQPAKLLTYEEILKDLDVTLLKAASAQEALRLLLNNDVAVILVDVFMPELDGFELASLIRNHPRFEKTAIIFISAVCLSELDRLRGYQSGAVDYVPVPVVPEILQAKVRVFLELYIKTRDLECLNRELEHRVAKRTAELEASNQRLQESEERLRLASEAAEFGTYDCSPAEGKFRCSAEMKRLLGCEGQEELNVEDFLDLIYEPDRAAVRRSLFGKRGDKDRYRVEFRVPHDGGIRWLLDCGRAFYDGGGETPVRVTGTVLDITERKLIEERQLLLMAELDHRVKNILANVGAIAKLSSKNSGSVSGFVEALEARIQAIARAHSMLRRDSWIGVDLRTYLSELLSPFINKRSHNIILEGEEAIDLSPKAAQSLALVFHELATNAVKYGALSVPEGNVTLSWSKVKERKGGVRLTWREHGGPRPVKIHRQGFGSLIIKTVSAEAGAKVVYDFGHDGVVFSFEGDIEGSGKGANPPPPAASFMNVLGDCLNSLARLRILLVEDELLLGLQAQTELETAGHKVVGFATSLEQGIEFAQELDFDFALLDIRLGDEDSVPIAEKLLNRKVPFAFVTGFEDELILPVHLRSAPRFPKPYSIAAILDSIVRPETKAEQRQPSLSAVV
jgi:PAS domain S-box-containing protein